MAIVRQLARDPSWQVWLLNRGHRNDLVPENVKTITADIHNEAEVAETIKDMTFDVVCEFIGFVPEDVERDYRLFKGKTRQYIYTSSASAYHKPVSDWRITEGTALSNPYWEYSRNKIACEQFLMEKCQNEGFPVTIVRPSHTYDERALPVSAHGKKGPWQVIKRIMEEKPVLIPGDGTSLWAVTFNRDFAVGYIGLMGNRHAIGEAFQITGDEELTWDQIYQTIADALHVPLHAYHVSSDFLAAVGDPLGYDYTGGLIGDKSNTVIFDNTKLKRIVPQMKTTIPFDQGVQICLDYVREHPECQVEDPEFDAFCDRVVAALEKAKAELLAGEK